MSKPTKPQRRTTVVRTVATTALAIVLWIIYPPNPGAFPLYSLAILALAFTFTTAAVLSVLDLLLDD